MKQDEIFSCICMTCGVRNDNTHKDGYWQNDHDNWLEYRDIYLEKEWFTDAQKIFGLTAKDLKEKFMDKNVKRIPLVGEITIAGSSGEFTVNPKTGEVLSVQEAEKEYHDIVRINFDEYKQYWKTDTIYHHIDILNVGYWTKEGIYQEPESDWRKEYGVGPHEIKKLKKA